MARKRGPGRPPKKKNQKKQKSEPQGFIFDKKMNPKTFWGIVTVLCILGGFLLLLAFFNIAGTLGERLNQGLKIIAGVAAYFIPLVMFKIAHLLIKKQRNPEYEMKLSEIIGIATIFLTLAGLFHVTFNPERYLEAAQNGIGGGYIGYLILFPLERIVGIWASLVILIALLVIGVILISNKTLGELIDLTVQFKNYIQQKIDIILKRKEIESAGLRVKGLGEEDVNKINEKMLDNASDGGMKESKRPVGKLSINEGISHQNTGKSSVLSVSTDEAGFKPFPLKLLEKKGEKPVSGDIRANARIIEQTLKSFGIGVTMEEVNIGPTVTQYTFRPLTGVKLSQIVTLQNDLSLALAAHPLRIEAPIPGKSAVGIELPNKETAIVRLREVLESNELAQSKGRLNVALGRDVSGKPIVIDIAQLPHLLIAGATGSGKSVSIHTIMLSLLYQYTPQNLRMIMVDPKQVELNVYNDLPHLLTPVITKPDKTVNALRWAVAEMERRFKLLSEVGKRDIISYNKAHKDEKLPYIVLVLDELADLMAVAANEVEAAVVRLAQMSRAVGIHLILATQRPSVNVITGLIKANITSRVAFTVASSVDSRTIIDMSGAEKLLGKGDMLYVASELGKPKRIQGAFVDEKEIKDITDYLKEQGEPEYNEEIIEKKTSTNIPGMPNSGGDDDEDELYEDAKNVVVQAGKASASLLQRRLRVGYARAARLLDSLEEKGIVGPAEGSKPREVYVDIGNESFEENEEEESQL